MPCDRCDDRGYVYVSEIQLATGDFIDVAAWDIQIPCINPECTTTPPEPSPQAESCHCAEIQDDTLYLDNGRTWTPEEVRAACPEHGGQPAPLVDLETIGRIMHESWTATKRDQGFHHPLEAGHGDYSNGVGVCDYCHKDLIPWEQLPETQKDINRHAFDAVLEYYGVALAPPEPSHPAPQQGPASEPVEPWRWQGSAAGYDYECWISELVATRWAKGVDAYKADVRGFQGDPLEHLPEELADALFYAYYAKRQRAALAQERDTLAALLRRAHEILVDGPRYATQASKLAADIQVTGILEESHDPATE